MKIYLLDSNSDITKDECVFCIHEHENWGDNKYCKECKVKERNIK